MFSVTQNGKKLDESKYNWDEKDKVFSTSEKYLVLDFNKYDGVTFRTGSLCTFKTDDHCAFYTGGYCIFETGDSCIFKTRSDCTFKTGSDCTFKTGPNCTFNTKEYCTFHTGPECTFNTKYNCFVIRHDVIGVVEIPVDKKIKLNGLGTSGYKEIKEEIKETNCNGKVVVIDGKEYTLQLKG